MTPARRPFSRRDRAGRAIAMAGGLAAIAAAWIWPLPEMARDLFAAHMFQHLLVMNVAALLLAAGSPRHPSRQWLSLPVATALQLGALWAWHVPAVFAAAHHHILLQSLMQGSLFAAAWAFWRAVLGCRSRRVWRPIFALLVTAKSFCLLGAIFIFARRTLYPVMAGREAWGVSALEDQQLAGLLMVSSCALVYVAAATAIFARWLATIGAHCSVRPGWNRRAEIGLVAK